MNLSFRPSVAKVVMLVAGLSSGGGVAAAAPPSRLEGFGPYRFGMSVTEVRQADPDAVAWTVPNNGLGPIALGNWIVVAEQKGQLHASFAGDPLRLAELRISFSIKGNTRAAYTKLLTALIALYGADFVFSEEKREVAWTFPDGARATLAIRLQAEDFGVIWATFSAPSGPSPLER